ncbi:hypothetical protein [Amycolatopsis sp. NPDC051716]|uniref:hypothetical protein n=1 Tax=Amycolatopsis sp. NPDC051716 TaxID=3155804 RepID=UPI00343EF4EB
MSLTASPTTTRRIAPHRGGGCGAERTERPAPSSPSAARGPAPQRRFGRSVPGHGRTSRGARIEPPASASTTATHRTTSIGESR